MGSGLNDKWKTIQKIRFFLPLNVLQKNIVRVVTLENFSSLIMLSRKRRWYSIPTRSTLLAEETNFSISRFLFAFKLLSRDTSFIWCICIYDGQTEKKKKNGHNRMQNCISGKSSVELSLSPLISKLWIAATDPQSNSAIECRNHRYASVSRKMKNEGGGSGGLKQKKKRKKKGGQRRKRIK